jgi:hypothetical protein
MITLQAKSVPRFSAEDREEAGGDSSIEFESADSVRDWTRNLNAVDVGFR